MAMQDKQRPDFSEVIEFDSLTYTFQDVRAVVDEFYKRVQNDPLLRVPFSSVHDWPHHIERLTHFWWTLFGGKPYMQTSYSPAEKHFMAGFNDAFLSRWLNLFQSTVNDLLTENKAQAWLELATRMGVALKSKNEFLKQHANRP